jgi:hypothetical protein
MNRIIRIVASALTLAAALPAAAQQAAQARVGLGVGLSTSEAPLLRAGVAAGVIAPQLYVPMNVTPNVRIEPQVGVLSFHNDANGDDISFWSIGTGVFWLIPLGGDVGLYVGPRLVFSFFDEENVSGGGVVTKTEATDFLVAAALGGELWVHPRFSVGAEGQFGYTSLGDVDVTEAGVTTTEPGGSSWATQGIVFVRVYLF